MRQVVAQVPRASARQSSAILSSIEFDRDASLFATAGVSKRICVFDFANVMRHPLQTQHRPHAELSTRSKLSCLSWNKYVQPHLISSDYEGVHHPSALCSHPVPTPVLRQLHSLCPEAKQLLLPVGRSHAPALVHVKRLCLAPPGLETSRL